jgi:hypothetical protein
MTANRSRSLASHTVIFSFNIAQPAERRQP